MKRCLIALALFASACSSNPPAPDPQAEAQPVSGQPGVPSVPAPQANVTAGTAAARNGPVMDAPRATPTIPQGARFTIFCESFTGDDHVKRATELKNILMSNAKNKDWYVVHQEGQSTIYHGYYREFDAAAATDAAGKKDAARAQNDKKLVEALPNPLNKGSRLFPRALFVSLDSPDPDAPAEWNLVNAGGYWSVEIASYTGFDRKQAAVESVRDARKMNIPAFYYHGANYSHVCIGAWPETAVRERSTEQVNSIPQNNNVFVDVRGGEISEEMRKSMMRDGKQVQVVVPKVEILDKTLIETMRAYPEHAVDGVVEMEAAGIDPATRKPVQRPKHSMLVRIPATDGASQTAGTDSASEPTLIHPNPSQNNLGARLRGLNQ